jgi:hypothetical protein
VHPDYVVPLALRHVGQGAIANDPGIIDQHVEISERVQRYLDHFASVVPVGYVVSAGNSASALRDDLVDKLLGWRLGQSSAMNSCPQIIDHDACTLRG